MDGPVSSSSREREWPRTGNGQAAESRTMGSQLSTPAQLTEGKIEACGVRSCIRASDELDETGNPVTLVVHFCVCARVPSLA